MSQLPSLPDAGHHTNQPEATAVDSVEDLDGAIYVLRRSTRKLPPPSFSLAPVVPLPPWQCVTLSALHALEAHERSSRRARTQQRALHKELTRYHADAKAREMRLLQQQREARARLGDKLSLFVRRYWQHRGDQYQQLIKVEFDAIKHSHDKRRQEDLLRETEELTKKLLSSIFNAKASANAEGGDVAASPSHSPEHSDVQLFHALCGDGSKDVEASLSLLDTQHGKRPLRHYQRSALQWMINLYDNKLNGILADEMGLGKTVQTIALLCYFAEYKNDWGPHLIVVPTTVVLNWKAELQRWAPGLKVLSYIGSAKERQKLRLGWTSEDAFHVCVTSYNLVVQDRNVFRRRPWGFLVLDEAHQVKNFASKKWQSLFDLQAQYRLLLTGTPLQNSMMELWSLFHFLLPFASAFRSNEEFKEWFSNPMEEMVTGRASLNEDVVRRLQAMIRPFMLRRLKKDVEAELPSKVEKVVLCRLSRRQRSLYDEYMQLAETRQRIQSGGPGGVLGVLLALRKVCDHPDLFEERQTVSPLALDVLSAIVLPVPRAILLRSNDYRGCYRFPSPPGVEAGLRTREEACEGGSSPCLSVPFAWLPCTAINLLFCNDASVPTGFSNGSEKERLVARYAPDLLLTNPTKKENALKPTATSNTADGAVSVISAWANEAFDAVREDAIRRDDAMRARMRTFHLQRYLAMATSINCYVPRRCRLRLKQHCIAETPWLCPTVTSRAHAILSTAKKVALYVPAVLAVHAPRLHCALPVSRPDDFCALGRTRCADLVGYVAREQDKSLHCTNFSRRVYDGAFFAAELWPMHVRRCFSFPDKGLLIHDCGKLQFLETALKQLRREGHRMLIFTQFVQMLNILERFLALVGLPYLRLDGSTKAEQRQSYVERFNEDERITCMILSTRSGGIGLNLTGADTVIFYDSDWNPTMDLQAQDRCHRIGQTKPVTIYRLISEHTVEESILQKARERKRLNNVVIRGGQFHAIAGVREAYEDSAAAFAALADPINLRSFFHDLDEDATVPVERASVADTPSAALLAEMKLVEDREDREAQLNVEDELRRRETEEAVEKDDDEHGAAPGKSASTSNAFFSFSSASSSDSEKDTEGDGGSRLGDFALRQVIRKRQREIMCRSKSALDRLLTTRFAACKEDDARARYMQLCEQYRPQIAEGTEEPPRFRKHLKL